MPTTRLATETWRLIRNIIQVTFASHMFLEYGYEIGPCDGPSMLPTINQSGDFILVEKWTHMGNRGYKVGDIIRGRHPYENHPICKRIIGKGGDKVRVDPKKEIFVTVPKGHVWLQGDNIMNSIDSRSYGPVLEATLKGRVLARISFQNTPALSSLTSSVTDISHENSGKKEGKRGARRSGS